VDVRATGSRWREVVTVSTLGAGRGELEFRAGTLASRLAAA